MAVLSGMSTYATALRYEVGTPAYGGVCLQGMVPTAKQFTYQQIIHMTYPDFRYSHFL